MSDGQLRPHNIVILILELNEKLQSKQVCTSTEEIPNKNVLFMLLFIYYNLFIVEKVIY